MSEDQQPEETQPDSARTAKSEERDDDTLTQVSELQEGKTPRKNKKKTDSSAEEKRKQFFKEELKRLQKSLETESSKIKAPPVKEHVPYCFNTLAPYYNTSTAIHVIERTGDDGKVIGEKPAYATRNTAIGLVDPWVNHNMDVQINDKVKVKEPAPFRQVPKKEKKVGEGSTMIPVFPHVDLDTPDLEARKMDYNDVPALRKELREKYSSQAKDKQESDYKRLKNDFYRMELHKLHEVHPVNRGNMKAAYFAYLQNSPGSKKAVKECVKEIEGDDSENTKDEEEQKEGEREPEPTEQREEPNNEPTNEGDAVEAE